MSNCCKGLRRIAEVLDKYGIPTGIPGECEFTTYGRVDAALKQLSALRGQPVSATAPETIIIETCAVINDVPRMHLRFNEFALLTAFNLLTKDCVEKHNHEPGSFAIFIPAILLNAAKAILDYPASKNMLRFVEQDRIGALRVCLNIETVQYNANIMWAVREIEFDEVVISSGTMLSSISEPEIVYHR